jgi:putative ABC transport system substrate-binding protein
MIKQWKALIVAVVWFTQPTVGSTASSQTHRLLIVMEGRASRVQPQEQGLRDGLEELGYIEGKNLVTDHLNEEGVERLRTSVASYVQKQRAELIVTLGMVETAAAKNATTKLPIIFLPVGYPVQSGFVKSLAIPGTNLTGLTFYTGFENLSKQLEVFTDVVPSMRRVLAFSDGRDPNGGQGLKSIKGVAQHLGIELTNRTVNSVADAVLAVTALPKAARKSGIFIFCSGLFRDLKDLATVATKERLPLFGCNAFQVAEQDVLFSYAPDLYSIGYRGAALADKILKGAKPQTLPVETPIKFELVINRRTATAIGLKIRPEILTLADRVFD